MSTWMILRTDAVTGLVVSHRWPLKLPQSGAWPYRHESSRALAHTGSPIEAHTFVTNLSELHKCDNVCMRYFGLASRALLVLTS